MNRKNNDLFHVCERVKVLIVLRHVLQIFTKKNILANLYIYSLRTV